MNSVPVQNRSYEVKCANSAVKGHNDKNGKYRITFIFRQ